MANNGDLPDLEGDDPRELSAAFASARLIDDEAADLGAVTFDPSHDGDELADGRTVTGWEVFVGDETEDELTDPELIRLPSLSVLLDRFPQLAPIVDDHDGSEASWVVDEGGSLIPWNGEQ